MSNELIERTVKYITKTSKLYESSGNSIAAASTSELAKHTGYNENEAHKTVLTRADATPEDIKSVIDITKNPETKAKALQHPKAPTESIKTALTNFEKKGFTPSQRGHVEALIKHPNAPKEKYSNISAALEAHKQKDWKPGATTTLNIGTEWGGKPIPTSRHD